MSWRIIARDWLRTSPPSSPPTRPARCAGQLIKVFMIHFLERFGGIEEEELELLVPDVLAQLIPLGLGEAHDDLIVQ